MVGLWFGSNLVMAARMNSAELITLIGVINDVSWTLFNLLNLGQVTWGTVTSWCLQV